MAKTILVNPNSSGLCLCGCGRKTTIATRNEYRRGHKKGCPIRYILGHNPAYLSKKDWSNKSKGKKRKPLSLELRKRLSELKPKGENSPLWKGGKSRLYKDGYYSFEYRNWRRAVFERDNYTCQMCGISGRKTYLTAHHIKSFNKYPELRVDVNNGLTLCERCHSLTDNYKSKAKYL